MKSQIKRHLYSAGIAALLAIGVAVRAQSQAAAPEFDAASIKPVAPGDRPNTGFFGSLKFTPGMVLSGRGNVSAGRIILEAYHLHDYQLIGGPAWLTSDNFALEAKADTPADEGQLRLMLQTLLTKRFKLVTHRETREMPVWALTVAKGGPKLHDMKPGEAMPRSREEMAKLGLARTWDGPLAGNMVEIGGIQTLVDILYGMSANPNSGMETRPVLDKTGLAGNYLFFFQWGANEYFKDVVQEVAGLKLEPSKAPVEVLVVDHIEKPDGN